MRRTLVATAAAALLLVSDAGAAYDHAGRWITDAQGRVVVIHGMNVIAKTPPYSADAIGVGADDAEFLAKHGFTAIRLGVMWKAVEPQRGRYDEAYLDGVAKVVDAMGRAGVATLLDFHQDSFNERYGGQGFPDWAVQDDGFPHVPSPIGDPALGRAWDNFYDDVDGVQASFRAFWQHVARRFKSSPYVLGYDLVNEPSNGTLGLTCLNPLACPLDSRLGAFFDTTIAALRQADPAHLAFYEPNIFGGAGGASHMPDTGDEHAGNSFHVYCTLSILGTTVPAALRDAACPTIEEIVFDQAERQSRSTGDALLMTEFGSTPHLPEVTRVAATADTHRVGWMHWTYSRTGVTDFAGTPSLVRDPQRAPSGDNVDTALLQTLSRPHPQLVSGTPQSWRFDPQAASFHLRYTTVRADRSGQFERYARTRIFLPEHVFTGRYAVAARDGVVVSQPGARTLVLAACPGAGDIEVVVSARGTSSAGCAAPRLRVTAPRRLATRRVTRVRVRVRDAVGPVAGARVRFANRVVRTDEAGRAALRVRLRSRGRRSIVVTRPDYPPVRATVYAQ